MTESPKKSTPYLQLTTLGLNFIQRQKHILWFSMIYPIFTVILQIMNILSILKSTPANQFGLPLYSPIIDRIIPMFIFILISLILIIKFLGLIKLRKKANKFVSRQKLLTKNSYLPTTIIGLDDEKMENGNGNEYVASITDLFYQLVEFLELIQKFSLILYVTFVIYIPWFVRYFLAIFGVIPAVQIISFSNIAFWLNLIDQICLIFFIVADVNMYRRWYGKLNRLKIFEQNTVLEFESRSK